MKMTTSCKLRYVSWIIEALQDWREDVYKMGKETPYNDKLLKKAFKRIARFATMLAKKGKDEECENMEENIEGDDLTVEDIQRILREQPHQKSNVNASWIEKRFQRVE